MNKVDYQLNIVKALQQRGLYEESLDLAIETLASLLETNEAAKILIEQEPVIVQYSREGSERRIANPATQLYLSTTEEIRKYMRDLGLVVAKPAGFVAQEKDDHPRQGDSLNALLTTISNTKPKEFK